MKVIISLKIDEDKALATEVFNDLQKYLNYNKYELEVTDKTHTLKAVVNR